MYNQNRQDQLPWITAGQGAIGQMSQGMQPGGQFTQTFDQSKLQQNPGYLFQLQQGQQALDRSAASKGMLLSGAQAQATTNYNQGMANTDYNNAYNQWNNDQSTQWNRLSGIAGTGQQANSTLGNQGTSTANGIANTQASLGNSMAANSIGLGNSLTSSLNTGVNAWNMNNMWNNMQNQGAYSYTGVPGSSNPNFGNNWNQPVEYAPVTYGG